MILQKAAFSDGERVEVELPAAPMRVRAPRWWCLRAIANLVLNALHAATVGQCAASAGGAIAWHHQDQDR